MLLSISPYALLCASKPRQAQYTASQYDAYSLSQAAEAPQTTASQAIAPAQHIAAQSAPSPAKRTHYIADIHARHTHAMRSTSQSPSSL